VDTGIIRGSIAGNYKNYADYNQTVNPTALPGQTKPDAVAMGQKAKEASGAQECQTCKNRRYQDASNDPGVSMKAPTKLTPSQAASAVASHEGEHYNRENSKAEREGREVVSNNIRIFTSICPECGKPYVSGGETTTVTKGKSEQEEFADKFFNKNVGVNLPKQVDVKL
jgi:hypothetical protein